eukprot:g14107.t1
MTFTSSLLSIGFMPLSLFLYITGMWMRNMARWPCNAAFYYLVSWLISTNVKYSVHNLKILKISGPAEPRWSPPTYSVEIRGTSSTAYRRTLQLLYRVLVCSWHVYMWNQSPTKGKTKGLITISTSHSKATALLPVTVPGR